VPAVVLSVAAASQSAQISWIDTVTLESLKVLPDRLFLSAGAGGILITLAIAGARRATPLVCVAGAAFVPPVLLFVVGIVAPVWTPRYVLEAVPAMAVLAGTAAARFGTGQAVAVLAVMATLAYPVQLDLRAEPGHNEASDRVATVIGAGYRPGDVIVFPDTHPSIPWAPRDIYNRYLPSPRPADVLSVKPQRTDGHLLAQECPAATCLGTPARVWILRVDTSADPYQGMTTAKRAVLSKSYRTVQHWQYPLLGIFLLERKPAVSH
jgi:mannosyltransferase